MAASLTTISKFDGWLIGSSPHNHSSSLFTPVDSISSYTSSPSSASTATANPSSTMKQDLTVAELRLEGNKFFTQQKYQEAIDCYSRALVSIL